MSEPDDIRAAAVRVYSRYLKDIGSFSLVDLLAEALMAERERCAKIADPIEYPGITAASDIERRAYDLRTVISRAIRRGTP